MNAVVALCHFCEVHGPISVFCTQTIRDTKLDDLSPSSSAVTAAVLTDLGGCGGGGKSSCAACASIGHSVGMLSQDTESNTKFLSTQTPVIGDVVPLIKQAAFRSLSCEVSHQKDGGLVFYGDAIRGHVLSHTFRIRDIQSRGFTKLFSIVILMKDKLFLLNTQPFLSKAMQNISKELQNYTQQTYDKEHGNCSERARRLNTGNNPNYQPGQQLARSLAELTGQENIFAYLHTHFTWILWAGTRYLTEMVTLGSPTVPPWIGRDTEEGFSLVQMDKEEWLIKKFADCAVLDGDDHDDDDEVDEDAVYSIRRVCEMLKSEFIAACYCALIGIQIVLRGPQKKTLPTLKCFRRLLPDAMHKYIRTDCKKYVSGNEFRIIALSIEVAVPHTCSSIFRIDFLDDADDAVNVKWIGELPNKWPALLQKITKAVDEKLFTDFVLNKHMKLLIEEWKNKVLCMQKITSNPEMTKIKKILGIQQQDQSLINYWINAL